MKVVGASFVLPYFCTRIQRGTLQTPEAETVQGFYAYIINDERSCRHQEIINSCFIHSKIRRQWKQES